MSRNGGGYRDDDGEEEGGEAFRPPAWVLPNTSLLGAFLLWRRRGGDREPVYPDEGGGLLSVRAAADAITRPMVERSFLPETPDEATEPPPPDHVRFLLRGGAEEFFVDVPLHAVVRDGDEQAYLALPAALELLVAVVRHVSGDPSFAWVRDWPGERP